MKRFSILLAVVFVLAFLMSASAQEVKVVNGGIVNGKATSLPKPMYPEAAKAAKVEGMIGVDVEIAENGMTADISLRLQNLQGPDAEPKKNVHYRL